MQLDFISNKNKIFFLPSLFLCFTKSLEGKQAKMLFDGVLFKNIPLRKMLCSLLFFWSPPIAKPEPNTKFK